MSPPATPLTMPSKPGREEENDEERDRGDDEGREIAERAQRLAEGDQKHRAQDARRGWCAGRR